MKEEIIKILEKDNRDTIYSDEFYELADDIIKLYVSKILESFRDYKDVQSKLEEDILFLGMGICEIEDGKVKYADPLDPEIADKINKSKFMEYNDPDMKDLGKSH